MGKPKQNLGQMFGGKIVNIDYNFQPSSQASTATVVIANENQNYQIPEFDTTVSLPPFGISMDVVEITQIKQNYKYLQVELVEHTHQILDKELIILYGEHTTHKSELNEESYWVFRSYFIDDQYWNAPRHPDMDVPAYPTRNRRGRDGINVIGFARASISEVALTPVSKDSRFEPEAGYLKFDKGILNTAISTQPNPNWKFGDPSKVNIEYGYHLSNLKDLLTNLGLKFKDDSAKYLDDSSVLFNDVGTVREVLSSVLSKIGMTWYIDPMTQRIKILTNADVARINANISRKHGDFNEPCASQIQFTKSLKDVQATHVVLKGDLNQRDQEGGSDGYNSTPPMRRDKLYRMDVSDVTKLSKKELAYIYRFLPLVLLGIPAEIISYYIYGTMIYERTEGKDWGELYGESNDPLTGFHEDFIVPDQTLLRSKGEDDTKIKAFWNDASSAGSETGLFDIRNKGFTAIELLSDHHAQGGKGAVVNPSDNYIPYIQDFAKLFGGIYISDAMNEKEANARVYNNTTRRGQTLDRIFAAPADAYISEIPELDFLVRILRRAKNRTNITVGELAQKTGAIRNVTISDSRLRTFDVIRQRNANTGIQGSNFHMIALQNIAVGGDIENLPTNVSRYIGSNLEVIQHPKPERIGTTKGFVVMGTKEFRPMMQSLRRNLEKLRQEALRKRYDYILVPFFKAENDNSVNEESAENPMADKGQPKFIRNLKAQERCFYKRSLEVMSMGVTEAAHFLENFGTLNPPTPCPLISSTVSYERGPVRDDFEIESGVRSISVSVNGSGGITTTIGYSSRQFAKIDRAITRDYLGSSRAVTQSTVLDIQPDYKNAYTKNL